MTTTHLLRRLFRMHLSWIAFIVLSRQIQINAIRFPIVIPGSWLKFPWLLFLLSEWLHAEIMHVFMSLTNLLCHLCLLWYVTVDIQMWSFLLGRHCLPLSISRKRKGKKEKVDGFVAAGEGSSSEQRRVCQSPTVAETGKKQCYSSFG